MIALTCPEPSFDLGVMDSDMTGSGTFMDVMV